MKVVLGPYGKPRACPSSAVQFGIDHAAIVVANAGECGPKPGVGPNNDAEGSTGWTFSTSGSSFGGFAAGIGQGGTKAARVVLVHRCEGASMSTTINVPSTPNPALDFFVGSSAGTSGSITIGSTAQLRLPENTTTTIHTCLPPSLRGQVAAFALNINSGSGACADVLNYAAWVDNVKVVEDPACGTTDALTNPGFEQGGTAFGAYSYAGNSGNDGQTAIKTGMVAHGGTHYFEIDSLARCSGEGITVFPTVPASNGTAGPALTFFAQATANPNATTTGRTPSGSSVTVSEGTGWMPYTVCLDPLFLGRPFPVTIAMDGGSGQCSSTGITESTFVDDLAVTTSSMCPAQ